MLGVVVSLSAIEANQDRSVDILERVEANVEARISLPRGSDRMDTILQSSRQAAISSRIQWMRDLRNHFQQMEAGSGQPLSAVDYAAAEVEFIRGNFEYFLGVEVLQRQYQQKRQNWSQAYVTVVPGMDDVEAELEVDREKTTDPNELLEIEAYRAAAARLLALEVELDKASRLDP